MKKITKAMLEAGASKLVEIYPGGVPITFFPDGFPRSIEHAVAAIYETMEETSLGEMSKTIRKSLDRLATAVNSSKTSLKNIKEQTVTKTKPTKKKPALKAPFPMKGKANC